MKSFMKNHVFRCSYCGSTHKRPVWFLLLYHVFRDRYYLVCDVCHRTNCFLLVLRVVHDSLDSKEKDCNKNVLWDNRLR